MARIVTGRYRIEAEEREDTITVLTGGGIRGGGVGTNMIFTSQHRML